MMRSLLRRLIALLMGLAAGTSAAAPPSPAPSASPQWPLRPSWRPNVPVDVPRTVKTMAYYTGGKRTFVVFRNGTCAQVGGIGKPEDEAKEILDRILHAHPDMNPTPMRDGNWLVQYSAPAATIVFDDEVVKHWDYIEKNHKDGLVYAEVLIGPRGQRNEFDRQGKIGLFGRARMFMDALDPVVVGVWTPGPGWQPR